MLSSKGKETFSVFQQGKFAFLTLIQIKLFTYIGKFLHGNQVCSRTEIHQSGQYMIHHWCKGLRNSYCALGKESVPKRFIKFNMALQYNTIQYGVSCDSSNINRFLQIIPGCIKSSLKHAWGKLFKFAALIFRRSLWTVSIRQLGLMQVSQNSKYYLFPAGGAGQEG